MSEKANALEPFLLLAKSAKGGAVVELIKQVTEAPNVFVFGELLELQSIKELEGTSTASALEVLKIFAHGTFQQYKERNLPDLTPLQRKKLQQLTIASLATKQKSISYGTLQSELEIQNTRELESLIVDCIYCGIIEGRLDQKTGRLEVDSVIGRDVPLSAADSIIAKLSGWCQNCEETMKQIEGQAMRANSEKESHQLHWTNIENEIANLRKNVKSGSVEGEDVNMEEANRDLGEKGRRHQQRKPQRRLLSRDGQKD